MALAPGVTVDERKRRIGQALRDQLAKKRGATPLEQRSADRLRALYMEDEAGKDPLAHFLGRVGGAADRATSATPAGRMLRPLAKPAQKLGGFAVGEVVPDIVAPLDPRFQPGSPFRSAVQRLETGREPQRRPPRKISEAGLFGGALTLGGNLLKDAGRAALGAPAGTALLARHPIAGTKGVAQTYGDYYGPLARGDVGGFAHNVGEHPLNVVLDASTVGAVAGKVARLNGRVAPLRRLEVDGGIVQPHASPNPVVRAAQHRFDRFSEQHPTAPVVGARARTIRRLPFEQERQFERTGTVAIPFALARRDLKGGEDMAFDVMYRYGDAKALERLDQEIAMRTAALERPDITLHERRGQERTVKLLERAREHVASPSPALRMALEEGRKLGDVSQQMKQDIGAISDAEVANRPQLHSRLVTGGRFVESPAPSERLVQARGYRNRLQGLYDRAAARRDAAGAQQMAKANARADQLEADAANASRPRTAEEARGRLAELDRTYETLLRRMEERVGRQKLKPEEAQRLLDEHDAKIAEAQAIVERERSLDPKTAPLPELKAAATEKTRTGAVSARVRVAEKRLARLQRERGRLVDAVKTGYLRVAHDPAETARRNLLRRKEGLRVPTLAEELRQHVLDELDHMAQARPDDPGVKAYLANRREAQQLRDALNASAFGDAADLGAVADTARQAQLGARARSVRLSRIGTSLVGEGRVLQPRGQSRVELLGGALALAKERVDRLEQIALRRQGEIPGERGGREFVGGETAPGARYMPDTARLEAGSMMARARSVTGRPTPLTRPSEGVLFSQGRARRGSKLVLEDYRRTARYRQQLADIERARSYARPLNPDRPGGLDPGYTYFNPEGVSLPRRFKDASEEDLAALTPREFAAAMQEDSAALNRDLFPSETDLANLPPRVREQVQQIDVELKRALEQSTSTNYAALSRLGQIFDTTNNITKASLIYLKGSYVPLNFAGNLAFLGLQQGVWTPVNLAKAAGLLGDFSPENLRWMDTEVGSGASAALGGEGRGLIARGTQAVADASGALADRVPRRAAIVHELAKIGVKSDADLTALRQRIAQGQAAELELRQLNSSRLKLEERRRRLEERDVPDEAAIAELDDRIGELEQQMQAAASTRAAGREQEALLNQTAEQAENSIVRFRGLSQTERRVVSRAIFIYPWLKGATRYGGHLVLDKPIRADLVAHVGEYGADQTEQMLGQIVSYLDGLVPFHAGVRSPLHDGRLRSPFEFDIAKPQTRLGARTVSVRNPASITPLGTAAQVSSAVGAALGLGPSRRQLRPIAFASPVAKAAIEAATGYDTFRGRPYPDNMNAGQIALRSLVGTPDNPAFPLLRAVKTAFTKPQTAPFEGPDSRQGNYVKEGGIGDALRMAFLGGLRERVLNLDAAQAKGREEQLASMDPVKRAATREQTAQAKLIREAIRVGVIGGPDDLPDQLVKSFRLRVQRQSAYAQEAKRLAVPMNRLKLLDRFKVDLQIAVRAGDLDARDVPGIVAQAQALDERQLKTYRQDFIAQFFGDSIVSDLRAAIREGGGNPDG